MVFQSVCHHLNGFVIFFFSVTYMFTIYHVVVKRIRQTYVTGNGVLNEWASDVCGSQPPGYRFQFSQDVVHSRHKDRNNGYDVR